ncbi:hypothetical protein FLAG1_02055 [Fusarium langsethiae]|uniref:Uncharacterized protein n=1 Tax=Fusarium langsethiae TaxID=179993 RepID=A0A0M9F3K7_FUSLA|nr:hypothetical protein FLAG1_02055 [Fusarium langsethiae]
MLRQIIQLYDEVGRKNHRAGRNSMSIGDGIRCQGWARWSVRVVPGSGVLRGGRRDNCMLLKGKVAPTPTKMTWRMGYEI